MLFSSGHITINEKIDTFIDIKKNSKNLIEMPNTNIFYLDS